MNFNKLFFWAYLFMLLSISSLQANKANYDYEPNLGFVEEQGQYKNFDNLAFRLHYNNMFIYFLNDRVVFISHEVENIPNEKSIEEFNKGNTNLATKLSAVTSAHRFDLIFEGINSELEIVGENKMNHTSDYYLGHCPQGILNVRSFEKIRYRNIYEGIDLVFYINQGALKYEYIVNPGVSPEIISLRWEGVKDLFINSDGSINFSVGSFNINDRAPVSFVGNKDIETRFVNENNKLHFEFENYNETLPLVIDPGLTWTSSLEYNGYGSWGELVTNSAGEFYIVDWEWNPGLADLTNYLASAGTSVTYGTDNTNNEVIISKFSTTGDLIWACQYGGSGDDDVNGGVELDDNDNLYIAGTSAKLFSAGSGDFPLQTWGAAFYQAWDGSLSTGTRGYLLRFQPDNTRQWATYLDIGANLEVFDISCGLSNYIYMTGKSGGYPTRIQAGSIPSGTGYLGALNGNTTATSFILEFDSSGALYWATWLPGETASTYTGRCSDIAVNKTNGNIYLAGDEMWSSSTRFSTAILNDTYTNLGQNDMFYMHFNSSNQPVPNYGQYIGGAGFDKINIGAANGDIELDPDGDLYVCGHTYSANFPVVDPGGCAYFDGIINDGSGITANVAGTQDGYLFKVNTSGTITYCTFFGGTAYTSMKQLKKDSYDNLWICGHQYTAGLPDISHTDYYNSSFVGTNANIMFVQLRSDDYMEWLSYYGYSAGYAGYSGFDIYEPAVDNVDLYLTGKFTGLTPIGGGYQYTSASSCTGAAKFNNVLSAIEPDAITPVTASDCSISEISVTGSLPVGANWVWYTGGCGGTQIGTGATISINPVVTTTYYVQAEGACVNSNCSSITVDPPVPATVSVDFPTICDGESATLTAAAGFISYDWSTGSTSDNITVSPSITTVYTVSVEDSNGCTAEVSTNIVVNPIPNASASNTGSYCEGNTISLTTPTVSGATYNWIGPDGFTSTSQEPDIIGSTVLNDGIYYVTVSAAGCTNSSSTTVVVNPGPASVASNGGPYCSGDNIQLSCTAIVGATYSWTGPNGFTSNQQNPIIGGCAVLDGGTYNLTVSLGGCSTSSTTDVIVNPSPASLATSTSPYCVGDNIELTTTAVTGATYSWTGPNGFTSNQQNPINSSSTLLDAGTYTVTVSLSGCTNSSSTLVSVNPVPSLSLGINTEPLCNGDSNGVIDVNISSGTPNYTIDWGSDSYITSNSFSTMSLLSAGNYSVTVTDNFSCSATESVILTQPGVLGGSITSIQNQNCAIPGQATVLGSSGTSPYTYSWPATAGGVSGGTASNLTVGTYNVTINDVNMCQYIQPVIIADDGTMSASSSITNPISCYGDSDGEITVVITGGIPNFNFDTGTGVITSGLFTNTFSGLGVGNYSITITDAMGCSSVQNINLTEPAQITTSVTASSDQVCSTLGSATVSGNNGVSPYQYYWPASAGGVSGNTASALVAGTYNVTVEDANFCSIVQAVNITDIGAITCSITDFSDPQCYNSNDGTITIDITSGMPNYSIDYGVGPITTATSPYIINGLASGNYNITVSDANGCSSVLSQTLTNPTELQYTSNVINNVSCNGLSDGSVEIVPFGGNNPYGISWSDPTLTGMTQNGLSFGTYDFTITDANNCQTIGNIFIDEPTVLSATENVTGPLCNGDNASATITPTGGVSPYSINWENGSTGFTNNSIPVNSPYGYTVTDANTCTYSNSVFASNVAPFTVSLTGSDVSCFGYGDGVAMVDAVMGGTYPITYEWNNGQINPQINNLEPGLYDITITDVNLCEAYAQIEIFEPEQILVSVSSTDADCSGVAGATSVTASGGIGSLSYAWSCATETTSDVSNIIPGIHQITVTDSNMCEEVESFEVQSLGAISVSINQIQDILCYGDSNGILEAITGSSNSPFDYEWSIGGNTQQMSGLPYGDYSVTITDAWNCSGSSQISISQPEQIIVDANVSNIGCLGENTGSIHLTVSGGTSPYIYAWSEGSDLPYLQNLYPGQYTVTVTDVNNCEIVQDYEIIQSDNDLEVNVDVISIKCYGESNGEIHVSTVGGNEPITYIVSGEDYISTSASHTGLSAGNYIISATDANGCSDFTEVVVSEPAELSATVYANSPSCFGNNDGSVYVSAIGGTAPYSYYLDGMPMYLDTLNSFGAGVYEVSIIDANGCEVDLGIVRLVDDPLVECIRIPNAFSPNGDGINDTWIIENLDIYDACHIQLFNRWGQEIRESRDLDFEWDGIYNGKKLPTGPYLYVVNIFEREPYVGIVTIVH